MQPGFLLKSSVSDIDCMDEKRNVKMNKKTLLLVLLACCSAVSLIAADGKADAPAKKQTPAPEKKYKPLPPDGGLKVSTTASARVNPNAAKKSGWHKRYDEKRAQIAEYKNNVQILMLGDSITHYWDNDPKASKIQIGGRNIRDKYFSQYKLVNLGYAGDRTQHTLWIVNSSGMLDNLKADMVILMIGTNNLGTRQSSAEVTAEAIKVIVESLRKKLPESKILLFGVFPRNANPKHHNRLKINVINSQICKLHDGKNVFYCDITKNFLDEAGCLSKTIMPDYLHPGEQGYTIWAEAIMPYVKKFVDKK